MNQKLPDEVRTAIVQYPDATDPRVISTELTRRFGRFVPTSVIVRVRGSMQRAANVNRARESASTVLGENLQIMEDTKGKLKDIFDDETLPLKDRLEASKELRQIIKMENDQAGIEDRETDTLFVIEGSWDTRPQET